MSKGTVKWDEENLKENEESRTATMKIDEPPTPFNFDYCDEENDPEDAPASGPKPAAQPGSEEKPAEVTFAAQWAAAGMDEVLSDPANLRPSFEDGGEEPSEQPWPRLAKNPSHPCFQKSRTSDAGQPDSRFLHQVSKAVCGAAEEELEERKKAFDAKRKGHYNMSAALSRKVEFDEEGEEDGKEPEADADEDELKKHEEFVKKRKAFYQERDRQAAERGKQIDAEEKEEED
mmetsp:Transcript_33199/g.51681  ORF Transcript_33199/g.51681 Transcript_33199/m.51681 type:complete len:232 (+) Transcript_33199:73-768(+)